MGKKYRKKDWKWNLPRPKPKVDQQIKEDSSDPELKINDIFHELSEENTRLLNELMFSNKCLNVLITFKTFVDFISNQIKSNLDLNETKKFEKLSEEVEQVLRQKFNENSFPITEELSQNKLNSENVSKVLTNDLKFIFDVKQEEEDLNQTFDDTFDDLMGDSIDVESDDQNIETNVKNSEETEDLSEDSNDSDYIPKRNVKFNQKTFKCLYCSFKCRFKKSRDKHIREKHNEFEPFVCEVNGCDFKTIINFQFENHMKAHNGVEPFPCDHLGCDYTSYNKSSLKKHRRSHKILFECNICDKKYAIEDSLKEHIEEHNNHDFKCDINGCHYRTLIESKFKTHVNRHKGIKPFQCTYDLCGKSFANEITLRYHILKVHKNFTKKESQYFCEDCGKRFTQKYWLEFHKVIHLDDSQKPLVCGQPNCQFRTNSESHLKLHQKKHSTDRPFPCLLSCGKFFRTKKLVSNHMVSHSDERNFVCEVEGCHKAYKTKTSLESHMLTHKEKTRFSCEWPECEYMTNIKKDITNHQFSHSEEKNVMCDWPQCGKTFKHKNSLYLHMKGHTNDKPQCPWPGCQHRTQFSSNMKLHIKRRHKSVQNI